MRHKYRPHVEAAWRDRWERENLLRGDDRKRIEKLEHELCKADRIIIMLISALVVFATVLAWKLIWRA
jgi:hypothetical protein